MSGKGKAPGIDLQPSCMLPQTYTYADTFTSARQLAGEGMQQVPQPANSLFPGPTALFPQIN